MQYADVRHKLLSLFDAGQLAATPSEWGFFHESDREIRQVGYATNLIPKTIEEAHRAGVQLLLTHHDSWEFVFDLKARCNELLERYNIIHAFFHAPLDGAAFGTSMSLAAALGLSDTKMVMPYAEVYHCGVTGQVTPTSFDAFAAQLSAVLDEPVRRWQNNNKPVQKVAIAAGAGNMTGEMKVAVDAGCDTYITGEYVLYSQQYAALHGMNLLVGSHTATEILGVRSMAELLVQHTDLQLIPISEPAE